MVSVNKVILIGNVGKDPEFRTMNNGNEVATFSLATADTWKDKTTGERRDRTEWHRIVVYGPNLISIVRTHIRKGVKVYIEGTLQTRKWTDNSGLERSVTEIIIQGFSSVLYSLESKPTTSAGGSSDYGSDASDLSSSSSSSGSFDTKIDDDIPF